MNTRSLQALFSRQFLLFIAVGAMSALVDIASMMLVLRSGGGTLVATTVGFLFGLSVNYISHVRMTFAARNNLHTAIRFLMIVGINYGITLALVYVAQILGANILLGKIASLPVVAINGFFLSKFWAFR